MTAVAVDPRADDRIAAVAAGPAAVAADGRPVARAAGPGGTAHSAECVAAVRWAAPAGVADSAGRVPSRAEPGAGVRWVVPAGVAGSEGSAVDHSVRAHRDRVPVKSGEWHRWEDGGDRRAEQGGRRSAGAGSGPPHWVWRHWPRTAASTDPARFGAVRAPTARRGPVADTARRRPDRARRVRRTRSPDLRSTARRWVGTVSRYAIVAHCARCFAGHPHPVGTVSRYAIVAHCASSFSVTRLRARRYLLSLRRFPGSSPLSAGSGCPRKRRHKRRPASRNSSAPAHAVIIANA